MTKSIFASAGSAARSAHGPRAGNALVIALGLMALIAITVAVSTEDAISVHGETFRRTHQISALAAVDAVLNQREGMMTQAASDGSLARWTGGVPENPRTNLDELRNNYGVDYVGNCAVLWKVEPVHSMDKANDQSGDRIRFIQNPSPVRGYYPDPDKEVMNDFTFMFRISAEARVVRDADQVDFPLARAQGERILSLSGEPLFRYAIFYAKDGVKGDLELSHGHGLTVQGGVYSNGAIYMGGGTGLTWDSLYPGNDDTLIGPDLLGSSVRCVGVDGIFRLSKPVMYNAFNFADTMGARAGFAVDSAYDLDDATVPDRSDPPGVVPGMSFATATVQGNHLNPYRVRKASTLVTKNGRTNPRMINDVAILGDDRDQGNDSRDLERPTDQRWNPLSLSTWQKRALTRVTNARKQSLPDTVRNRPLEAQALVYGTDAGPGATDDPRDDLDEHLEAFPLFMDPKTGARVPFGLAGAAPHVEVPGTYLSLALGDSNAHFVRKSVPRFDGWEIRQLATAAGASPPAAVLKAGLIIRERPAPDLTYLMAGAVPDLAPANESHRGYVPFAYGKHKRPHLFPFTPFFMTDRATSSGTYDLQMAPVEGSGTDGSEALTNQEYFYGGHVRVRCVNNAACGKRDQSPEDNRGYHRTNMRVMHLKMPVQPDPATGSYPTVRNLAAPSAYFARDSFKAVQCRIFTMAGGYPSQDADGRKAGLIIMPMDSSTEHQVTGTHEYAGGLNSRRPYVGIFYSPERGFFTQRRFTHSQPGSRGDTFTNTDDGYTEPGTATVSRSSNIRQVWNSWRSDVTRTGEPTTTHRINTGEDTFTFRGGDYTRYVEQAAAQRRAEAEFDVKLNNDVPGGFVAADYERDMSIWPQGWGLPVDAPEEFVVGIIQVVNATNVRVRLRRPNEKIYYGPANSKTWRRDVADNVIYRWHRNSSGGLEPSGEWDDAIRRSAGDEERVIDAIENVPFPEPPLGRFYQVDRSVPPDPSPELIEPDLPSLDDGIPDLKDKTFKIPRGVNLEINSYLSQQGTWFTPPVRQYLPDAGIREARLPDTSGFRPDMWTKSVAPLGPPKPSAPTSVVADPWADAQIARWSSGRRYDSDDLVQSDSRIFTCSKRHDAEAANRPLTADGAKVWTLASNLSVRIERDGDDLRFLYYAGPLADPAPSKFNKIRDISGAELRAPVDLSESSKDWIVGLASQSGRVDNPMSVTYSNVSIETSLDKPNNVIDRIDWEERDDTGRPNLWTRYMASQYQVFWGTREITEAFFAYNQDEAPEDRPATEVWFYNPREFWSQSRWWNAGDKYTVTGTPAGAIAGERLLRRDWIEKETGASKDSGGPILVKGEKDDDKDFSNQNNTYWRRMMARTTVLDVNLEVVQRFIRDVSLLEATSDKWGFDTPAMIPAEGPTPSPEEPLSKTFSGLIYAARTNRYPWNPVPVTTAEKVPAQLLQNPFNPELPNIANDAACNWTPLPSTPEYRHLVYTPKTGSVTPKTVSVGPLGETKTGNHSALPIKPCDFHHGVMISNGSRLDWGGNVSFKDSALTFVTPNQIYLRGALNDQQVGTRDVPMAIMGDTVTLLSNRWSLTAFQRDELDLDDKGAAVVGGTLAGGYGQVGDDHPNFRAEATNYRTCIVTNNQPTTRDRVRLGEGASVVNNLKFLESWAGRAMSYRGSLVVLDTARYTRSFLLEGSKDYGSCMMGVIGWNAGVAEFNGGGKRPSDWDAAIPRVYTPPTRNFAFNNDLLTQDGTPPFAPFSFNINGIASWSRPTQ